MATISIYLDARRLKKDGTANVCARISNRNTTAFLATGYSVPPDCWKNGKVIKGKSASILRKSPSALNALIAETVAKYEIAMRKEIGVKSSLTAQNIRDLIAGRLGGKTPSEGERMTISEALRVYSSNRVDRKQLKDAYISLAGVLPTVTKDVCLDDIDEDAARRIVRDLTGKYTANTVRLYIGRISAGINYARAKGRTVLRSNPFAETDLPKKTAKKRSIGVSGMRRIFCFTGEGLKGEKLRKSLWAADMMKLMFCLCGINWCDICSLTAEEMANGRIDTTRNKTDFPINVRIEPEAKAIIDRYGIGTSRFRAVSVATLNNRCKSIIPGITSYCIRHTWASLAADVDGSDRIISMGLSHAHGEAMNQIYITADNRALDKANRKILDYVIGRKRRKVTIGTIRRLSLYCHSRRNSKTYK